MNKFSNILKVSPDTDLYMEFMNILCQNINNNDKNSNLPSFPRSFNTNDYELSDSRIAKLKKNNIIEPILNSQIEKFPNKSVDEVVKEDTYVILTLNILDILPRNVIDYTCAMCPTTNESRLAKNFNNDEIKDGKYLWSTSEDDVSNCKLYYNLMFVATENPLSNKNIKLFLSSYDDEGVINKICIQIYILLLNKFLK